MSKKESSIFDVRTLKDIHAEIKEVYLSDSRPWIIGFSGGKDSTAALQLIWYAISELPKSSRQKPIYVISSDTLVETPIIVGHVDSTLERINKSALDQEMPFHTQKVKPITSETFWTNLIGRGYPAPSKAFRWCTERMKIRPADRFILEKVSQFGEVVLVLGVRKSESTTRAQVMSLYEIKGSPLSRHSRFSGTYVYTPIKDFSLDDVWAYLLQTPSPIGNNNRDLLALYQSANSGECPLVVDKTTPSCGNSRFGCWVCTVVAQDKTIEGLIDSGQEWLEPLFQLRNYLAATQDPNVKHLYREYRRRDGTVRRHRNGSGTIVPGPYTLDFCKQVLKKLLEAQLEVRRKGPDPNLTLITSEELHEIRRLWRSERGDWEDSVPMIYHEVTGGDMAWIRDDIGHFTSEEARILDELCVARNVPTRLIIKLLSAEQLSQGMKRRSSIYASIDKILREEWRPENELTKESIRVMGGD